MVTFAEALFYFCCLHGVLGFIPRSSAIRGVLGHSCDSSASGFIFPNLNYHVDTVYLWAVLNPKSVLPPRANQTLHCSNCLFTATVNQPRGSKPLTMIPIFWMEFRNTRRISRCNHPYGGSSNCSHRPIWSSKQNLVKEYTNLSVKKKGGCKEAAWMVLLTTSLHISSGCLWWSTTILYSLISSS